MQQLADGSALLVELIGTRDLLARIAGQARELVTGATATAISLADDGPPAARMVDAGEHSPDEPVVAAVLESIDGHHRSRRGETSPASSPTQVRRRLPACSSILWVVHRKTTSRSSSSRSSASCCPTVAVENTGRLRALIEDLLLAAESDERTVSPRPADVDLMHLLDGLERQYQPWMNGRLEIHLDPPGSIGTTVVTDGGMVRRILGHLLDNARKYAPDGPVQLTATRRDGQLQIDVSDHGPGIAPEHHTQVFERFIQLDASSSRTHGGLGLGLHLCHQLAESLDGSLRRDRSPAGGARFTLTIPTGTEIARG